MVKVNKKFHLGIILVIINIILLSSCETTSLPAPESPEDTLLILRVKAINETTLDSSIFGNYKICFVKNNQEHWFTIWSQRPYTYIHGLAPGTYMATQLKLVSPYHKWDIIFPVKIAPGQLRIAPFEVAIRMYMDKTKDIIHQEIGFNELDFKERVEISKEFKEKDNYLLWDVDYSE